MRVLSWFDTSGPRFPERNMSPSLTFAFLLIAQDAVPPVTDAEPAPVEPVEPAPVEPVEPAPVVPIAPASVAVAVPPEVTTSISAVPGKGFTVKTSDDAYSITLRPRVQLRNTTLFSNVEDGAGERLDVQNEAQVRTLRLILGGSVLSKDLKYSVQLAFGGNDFDATSPSPIFDAYVEYVGVRDANVRVGQYFVPFDRARTIREFALQFTDRQQVVRELTLDRDVGVSVSSNDLFGTGWLGYAVFVGTGEGRNQFGSKDPGPLVSARAIVRPFGQFDDDTEGDLSRSSKPRLALGVAGAYNHESHRVSSTLGAPFVGGSASYAHGAADLVFKWYGFSLLTEVVTRQGLIDVVEGEDAEGKPVTTATRSGTGYFAQAGLLVTDNVELVARFEDLYAHEGTDAKLIELVDESGRQAGGGVNVYLNGHAFKLQLDAFQTFGSDFDLLAGKNTVRAQLDASF
jgi:phosphate-selective porin OprO/OprP